MLVHPWSTILCEDTMLDQFATGLALKNWRSCAHFGQLNKMFPQLSTTSVPTGMLKLVSNGSIYTFSTNWGAFPPLKKRLIVGWLKVNVLNTINGLNASILGGLLGGMRCGRRVIKDSHRWEWGQTIIRLKEFWAWAKEIDPWTWSHTWSTDRW